MATTPTIVSSTIEQPDLIGLDSNGKQVRLFIVGFSITGDRAIPITWPHFTGPVFHRSGGQYRRFDLASGLVSGEAFTSLAEVPK
jgi:hypothetical protein